MDIRELQIRYSKLPQAKALLSLLGNDSRQTVQLQGLTGSAAPLFFSGVAQLMEVSRNQRAMVFILNDADEAGYFYHDLTQVMGSRRVLFFPSGYRRAAKYGQRDAANEILRTEVITSLSAAEPVFVVTSPEAVAEKVVSKKNIDERRLTIAQGETHNLIALEHTLVDYGFQQTDYVYEPGQFALRGSLLDVYSFSSEQPFRIDFFGDDVETIRTFEVETQLSVDKLQSVTIVPELSQLADEKVSLFELLPADSVLVARDWVFVRDRVAQIYDDGFSRQAVTERTEGKTEMERQQIESEMRSESQLLTSTQLVASIEPLRRVELLSAGAKTPRGDVISFKTAPQPLFHKNLTALRTVLLDYLAQGYQLYMLADSKKQQQRLRDILDQPWDDGEPSKRLSATPSIPFNAVDKTLHEGFVDHQLHACLFTDHQIFDRFHKYNLKSDKARAGKMALTMKELMEMEPGDFVVHVDFGVGKFAGLVRVPLPPTAAAAKQGSEQGYQEMIRLVYQRGDIVDVSIHSLYKISKFRNSGSGEPPRLSTLGTGAWDRMKERTKKRIKDIARDLIRLYAKRRGQKGFAFSPDTFMQHELEASFLYEDTPDQLKATNDVKSDMERARPMDRLVCGDVGFGKTEVAIRAAFKAACDSKQVAVLVPTTVLAFQHFQTFRNRLRELPVRVEYLSRARSTKQTRQVLDDLAQGRIDILIGTHKLIGKQVKWKDLGLLIIDEEQKFGVAVKEKLRQMKTNVDTLTMSATPIPRTLQFSLMGARDMSIMRTPPPNRYPVTTELATFGHEVIADAINFELSRNGQVFFVNDRISGLAHIEELIHQYVPDARVAIGHGQMKPEELEEIVLGFINHDYDVLLSTTIVENGIDISNANTIIINDAHRFGLSDLHQMRGRVGRSNRKAFCYLLSPPLSALSPEARRRLEALESFSGLGSGFALAMQDLDIRGAGNLLGAEQSGFMEDLGYETYLKILKEAMAELRNEARAESDSSELCLARTKKTEGQLRNEARAESGELELSHARTKSGEAQLVSEEPEMAVTENSSDMADSVLGDADRYELGADSAGGGLYVSDCALESDLGMYFPDSYVPGSSERMLLYRELDNLETEQELEAYRLRLIDRFGPVPHEGEELMQVVALRRLGKMLGCEKIILRQGRMQMQFVSRADSPYYQSSVFERVLAYATANLRRCQLKEVRGRRLMQVEQVPTVKRAVGVLQNIENGSAQ